MLTPSPLSRPILHVTILLQILSGIGGELLQTNSVHKTPAAERPVNDLWCYRCLTMDGSDKCADLRGNNSQRHALKYKCKDLNRLCMVKRFSYTVSTENSTSMQKMWSLERNCTKHCEPGCIVIGERTKLYACTSCCDTYLCNNGTGRASSKLKSSHIRFLVAVSLCLAFISNSLTTLFCL